jgi:hypothetical protein
MKQIKKSKLALATQTVRTMTTIQQLEQVAGGSLPHTKINSQCTTNMTTLCGG